MHNIIISTTSSSIRLVYNISAHFIFLIRKALHDELGSHNVLKIIQRALRRKSGYIAFNDARERSLGCFK